MESPTANLEEYCWDNYFDDGDWKKLAERAQFKRLIERRALQLETMLRSRIEISNVIQKYLHGGRVLTTGYLTLHDGHDDPRRRAECEIIMFRCSKEESRLAIVERAAELFFNSDLARVVEWWPMFSGLAILLHNMNKNFLPSTDWDMNHAPTDYWLQDKWRRELSEFQEY